MIQKAFLFLAGMASSAANILVVAPQNSDLQQLQTLIQLNQYTTSLTNSLGPQIMNLYGVQDRMKNAKNALMSLSTDDDQTVEIVVESFSAIGSALQWADELAKEFADTAGMEELLKFVNEKKPQLIQFTGAALEMNLKMLSMSTEQIVMSLNDVVYLASQVDIGGKNTKKLIQEQDNYATSAVNKLTPEQMDLWERTLEELIRVLDWTSDDAERIRNDLEKVQRDLIQTKASIEGMVATANVQYEQTRAQLQSNVDAAQRKVDENTGCFKDAGRALATIFSFGISCAVQDHVLNELKSNRNNLQNHLNSYVGDVSPSLASLDRLASVASTLYSESDTSIKLVRNMETELSTRTAAFKLKADKSSLCIRLQAMRTKMITDIDGLLNTCQVVSQHTKTRANAYEQIHRSVKAASLLL